MKYIVIGLGSLGREIANNQTKIGNEVIGVDINMHRVENIKNNIAGAICLDSTDEDSLKLLPIKEVDAIFVTYGKNFGISVQTVALLKSFGAGRMIVRSISPIHETVIRSIGVAEIMTPEKDFSSMYVAQTILGDRCLQWDRITDTHHLFKIKTPGVLVNQSIETIDVEENFNIRLVAIERLTEVKNMLGMVQKQYMVIQRLTNDLVIEQEDILVIFGRIEGLKKLASL
ncbi:MAG: TrkA family potassium uptake protein [Parabacteroides sp.]|nr:TrkA family potassium uptake protein [Parabacteroides sp.]